MNLYRWVNRPRPVAFHAALAAGLVAVGYWLGKR
jgi:hypothetical protein